MQDTRITKERIKNHFAYGWWKYVLLAVLAIFGWNIVYTTSAYRAPKDKRLDVYFVTHSVPDSTTTWFSQKILEMYPEVEDSSCVSIAYTEDDNYYGSIQLSTYIGAGEGDIYMMTGERFDAFKDSGAFVNLEPYIESGEIDLRGIDASRGIATTEDGERGVFGIPAETLYGMMDPLYGIDNRDLMICVMAYTGNLDIAVRFVDWLVEEMLAPKPQALIDYEASQQGSGVEQGLSEISSY